LSVSDFSPPPLPTWVGTRGAAGEVAVWSVDLDCAGACLPQLERVLDAEETARGRRFHFARDRAHFIASRGLLRIALGACLGAPPAEVRFCYGPNGKPALDAGMNAGGLEFNVAHSHGRLLIAVVRGHAVGIDVEKARPEVEIETIAERFFCPEETRQLRALEPGDARREGFFNCWTRKEAYLKAHGEGIAYGLERFAVTLAPGERRGFSTTSATRGQAAAGRSTAGGPRPTSSPPSRWRLRGCV
jgi:4'-phosphopantetheinyl transferase